MKCELQEWLNAAAIDRGKLFRRVNKAGRTRGDGMTEKSVWHIVKKSSKAIGLDKLVGCKQRIQSAVNDRIGIEPQL